jgi:serpin B
MDRRSFLALVTAPALWSLLQSCADDEPGDTDTTGPTTPSGGFGQARSSVSRRRQDPAIARGAARSVNAFGADLYRRLAAGSEANLVVSPASILMALAMTRAGAVGTTADEMDRVLHVGEAGADPTAIHPALNALAAQLESRSGTFPVGADRFDVQLAIANSLWGQQGLTWAPAFLDLLAAEYGAGMFLVDYLADPEGAREAINEWVADATEGRIPELLDPGTVTPEFRLSLVNAVYLKAPWQEPFVEDATTPGEFTRADGSMVEVPFMRASRDLSYARGAGWQAVELPYVGGSLAMVLLVPDAGALTDVEAALAEGVLDAVTSSYTTRQVQLALPRFDLETKFDLSRVLGELGMTTAFDPTAADFSGMTADERLFIGVVVHQANITVDERGTEAAAATAVGMAATAAPVEPPVELTIDRPFVYAVRDVPTGAVLFLGRVGDPS